MNYVMFGYNKDDIYDVGYLKSTFDFSVTDDIFEAKLFKNTASRTKRKSATPTDWLELLNEDERNKYVFHLVATSRTK